MHVIFVRHSLPSILDGRAPNEWPLSDPGRTAAQRLGAQLGAIHDGLPTVASSEVKAVETARLLGGDDPMVDIRLGEVAKPWYPLDADHQAAALRYLRGAEVDGWEPRRDALARFNQAIGDLEQESIVVTHGTILSLWLHACGAIERADDFWLALRMPDVWLYDTRTGRVTRLAT